VRLIGFGVSRLCVPDAPQLPLFDPGTAQEARQERLSRTVDDIRRKLGGRSIRLGAAGLGRESRE
jgi:hypothetical protein